MVPLFFSSGASSIWRSRRRGGADGLSQAAHAALCAARPTAPPPRPALHNSQLGPPPAPHLLEAGSVGEVVHAHHLHLDVLRQRLQLGLDQLRLALHRRRRRSRRQGSVCSAGRAAGMVTARLPLERQGPPALLTTPAPPTSMIGFFSSTHRSRNQRRLTVSGVGTNTWARGAAVQDG